MFQIVAMCGALGVPWAESKETYNVIQFSSPFSADLELFSIECLAGFRPALIFFIQCLIPTFVPFYLFVCFLLSKPLSRITGSNHWALEPWDKDVTLNTLGSIFHALFISLLTMASRPMSYFDHPNKEMSVMRYPTVVIGQSKHLQQLAISLWMFSALLIPFIAWNVYGSYTAGNRTVQMSKKSMRKITVKGDIILL